jgi:hypothetical protein
VAVSVGVEVSVGVDVNVEVSVGVDVDVEVSVGVDVSVGVCVSVAVDVIVIVGVAVGLGFGMDDGSLGALAGSCAFERDTSANAVTKRITDRINTNLVLENILIPFNGYI